MNAEQTVFSQITDFLPLHEFRRCVRRSHGNYRLTTFSCLDQFLCMCFAQLTYQGKPSGYPKRTQRAMKAKALPHGFRWEGVAQHVSGCQREARLENLSRFCSRAHQHRATVIRERRTRCGSRRDGLCLGFDNHRPVPVDVSLGALPEGKGRGQTPHSLRSSRKHTDLYPYIRWEVTRCQRAGLVDSRTRLVLHHGQGIH